MISNIQLCNFCRRAAKLPTRYMWGTYGNVITNELIKKKAKQYPKNYSEGRQLDLGTFIGKDYYGCDCAGLIKWALWTNGQIGIKPTYNEKTDRGTGGLWTAASSRGAIKNIPEEQGVIVYKQGHVGVYLGDGDVCECTLGARGDGVVITKLAIGGWTHWLKIPEIMYVQGRDSKVKGILSKIIKGALKK